MNANTYDSPATTGGNREDLRDILTILEPTETPFTSMIEKKGEAAATFTEVLADKLRAPRTSGTREGQDAGKGGNKAVNRKRFGTYQHRMMDEFGVSDVQEAISKRGGVAAISDEYGNSKAKCLQEMKRDIEAVCCADQNHSQGTDSVDMTTRGAFSWVSNSAQSSNPVDANFRTLAGAILSGVGTNSPLFTETQLNSLLKNLKTVYGGKRTYECIAGNTVIDTVDNFTRVNQSTTNARYQVHEMADEHEITLMVQVFESSFGRVNMIPTEFNKVSAGAGDPTAALIINPDLWFQDFLDTLHSMDLPELGGGPLGYCKAMFALLCKSPRGNGKIYNT